MLKNVGLICDACSGPGLHYNCELEVQKREGVSSSKKMCLCFWSTHPYLSKEQLTPPIARVIAKAMGATAPRVN